MLNRAGENGHKEKKSRKKVQNDREAREKHQKMQMKRREP